MVKVPQLTLSQSQITMFSSVIILGPVDKNCLPPCNLPISGSQSTFSLGIHFYLWLLNSFPSWGFFAFFFLRPVFSSSAYIDDLNILLSLLGTKFPVQVHRELVILYSLTEAAYIFTYLYLFT